MEFTNERLADRLIRQSIELGASDLHIEPLIELCVHVRVRIDGLLQKLCTLPWREYGTLVTQLKIDAGMDIAEKRLPQDGRSVFKYKGQDVDLRLSSLPTINGEKIVVRILDKERQLLALEELDFSEEHRQLFQKLTQKPNGLILVTGPTGSGKTTTMYAALEQLDKEQKNIITIEDPVEYKLAGINQVAVNRKAGLNFASGLRSIVRQDPDIIMLGEIRDAETALIAIQAALTGHLVFSTLHTNDAVGTISRLVDMGVERYLLASALRGVLSQRLVRRVCPHCKQSYVPDAMEREYFRQHKYEQAENMKFYHGIGCPACRGMGYKGRAAVHELLVMNDALAECILNRRGEESMKHYLEQGHWRTLVDDGRDKVLAGVTDIKELWRVGLTNGGGYVH